MTSRIIPALLLFFCLSPGAVTQPLGAAAPLPPVTITDKGELLLDGEDFSFAEWNSSINPGKVHVLQYFAGTMGDSKIFEPFTDLLQEKLDYRHYHVTTIINLDASLWGTTGFVVAEVKASKKKFPQATIVLDAEGTGADIWGLGKKGAVLAILDKDGIVRFLTREPLSPEQMDSSLELVRSQIDS